ncbi:hypothetical protein HYX09_02815, partial [Candidatus Woesearchaeota archaeon]|nr:hypothetical protein [Candidatus Woesearchaeota archaeon]
MRKIAVIGIVMILLMSNLVVAPGQSDGSIRATTAVPITDPDRLQENTVYWWKAPGYVESDPTPDDPNDGYRQMVRIGDRFYGIATDTAGTPHQGVTDQPGIYLADNPDQWRLKADEGRNIQYIEDKAAVAFVDAQSQGTFSLRNGRFVLPGETAAAQGAPGATAPPAEGQGSTSGAQTAAGTGAGATPPGQQIQTRDVVQVQGKSAIVMSVNADGSLVVRNSNGDDSTVRADAVSRLYTSQEWDRIMGATEPNVYGLDILGRIDEGYTYNSATG